jgi:hypothetical protein
VREKQANSWPREAKTSIGVVILWAGYDAGLVMLLLLLLLLLLLYGICCKQAALIVEPEEAAVAR